jgi:hypothetical protein
MTYDNWKATNPEDEALCTFDGCGGCDCCGNAERALTRKWAFGNMETWVCGECSEEPSDFWDRPAP